MYEVELVWACMIAFTFIGWTLRGVHEYKKNNPLKYRRNYHGLD